MVATEEAGKKQGMSQKILIVEDEENERTGLAELVTSWGYRTETAADGVVGRTVDVDADGISQGHGAGAKIRLR